MTVSPRQLPAAAGGNVAFRAAQPVAPFLGRAARQPEACVSPTDALRKGYLLYESRQYRPAIASFNQALKLQPREKLALHGRGLAHAQVGCYETAARDFERALALCLEDPQLWYNHGVALSHLKHHRRAIHSFDRSIELNPNSHHAWYNRSHALRSCGHYRAALENLNRVVYLKPDCCYAWRYRGFILSAMKRYPEAIASFNESLQINERNLSAWYGKAQAAVRFNDLESAIHCLHQTFRLNPVGYQHLVRSRREFDPVRSDGRFIDLISNLA
ncbi:MAG: tetratricopeptide repeat protein [Elainellaceae cyanobacterium]